MPLIIALLTALLLPATVAAEPLRIATAANFKATLEQINRLYESDRGVATKLTSASTGVIASQILNGAPFDVFFAADRQTPLRIADQLSEKGVRTFCYAIGRLVLLGGNGQLNQLANPSLSLAIANPRTAPYGRAAVEVLKRPEFADGSDRKLIRGNNAVQTYQFWHSGGVDLALVPASLSVDQGTPVPQNWHQPLAQYALVVRPSLAVQAYLEWFESARVRTLITDARYQTCP
ncbi:MAG: molybdate ABC transporter substrate-binding protein [Pseudomonadota bacterium]